MVAPVTRTEMIGLVRSLARGNGAQGAKPGSAICTRADYEIEALGAIISEQVRRVRHAEVNT